MAILLTKFTFQHHTKHRTLPFAQFGADIFEIKSNSLQCSSKYSNWHFLEVNLSRLKRLCFENYQYCMLILTHLLQIHEYITIQRIH